MKHLMVTSYSVDEVPVKSTTANPIYGIGQGATGASPNWTLVSNVSQKPMENMPKAAPLLTQHGT
eukprot:6802548-Ditylum_brightwellii.AAC.1